MLPYGSWKSKGYDRLEVIRGEEIWGKTELSNGKHENSMRSGSPSIITKDRKQAASSYSGSHTGTFHLLTIY